VEGCNLGAPAKEIERSNNNMRLALHNMKGIFDKSKTQWLKRK
jgi:hypothetical protein